METKLCNSCQTKKLKNSFYNRLRASDGKDSWCILCRKNYYAKNKDIILSKSKAHRSTSLNKEQERKTKRAWRAANKDKRARQQTRRKARLRGSNAEFYTEQEVLFIYGTNCHICNEAIDMLASRRSGFGNWELGLHIDHLVSLANGGADSLENVRPAHAMCNLRKSKY
jgi:5-methylcytosine-specific restriction endonuclease McrA